MEEKKEQTTFQAWINSVPTGKFPDVRKRIISECYITRANFSHWKLGATTPPPLKQLVINRIAREELNQEVFEVEQN